MTPLEDEVCEYIAGLWGRNRREFARRYWAYLAYGLQEPPIMCFGAPRISDRLKRIGRKHSIADGDVM